MTSARCFNCRASYDEREGRTCVNGHFLCMECISDIYAEGVQSFNLQRPDKGCPLCGAPWDKSKPYWEYVPYNIRKKNKD
jgi:hypothetical protein